MAIPSKTFGIDPTGRVLVTELGRARVATRRFKIEDEEVELRTAEDPPLQRRKLFIKNVEPLNSSAVIYIGTTGVDTDTGFPLYQFDEIQLDVGPDAVVKAIAGYTPTVDNLDILEVE